MNKTRRNTILLLLALSSPLGATRTASAQSCTFSPDVCATMQMTQQIVGDSWRIVTEGLTPQEAETAKQRVSMGNQAIMNLTQDAIAGLYDMFELVDRAYQGDQQAAAELDRRLLMMERQTMMLQGQVAAGQIRNSVQRQQLASSWFEQASSDRELGTYFARQGDYDRASYHGSRALDYDHGARQLLEQR